MTGRRKERVAVAGCGVFANNHIEAWKSLDGAQVVAVCDRDTERARAASSTAGGIPFFSGIAEMVEKASPDVVDIVTPPPTHRELVEVCAANKTNAIVQKPLAMSLQESVAIADSAERAGITLMVHENFRFQRPIREVKRLIGEGLIGEPQYCSVSFRTSYTVFPRELVLQKGDRLVLMDMGMHVFDVARFLMGEITELSCRIRRKPDDGAGDVMASAVMNFAGGALGVVDVSSASLLPDNAGIDTLLSVEGRNGTITLGRRSQITIRTANEERSYSAAVPGGTSFGARWAVVQDSVIAVCRHWLDARAGYVQLETSLEDNLRTVAAVESCYISARSGASLAPSDVLERARARSRTLA